MPKNIEKNQKKSNDNKRNFLKNKKLHFSKFQKKNEKFWKCIEIEKIRKIYKFGNNFRKKMKNFRKCNKNREKTKNL